MGMMHRDRAVEAAEKTIDLNPLSLDMDAINSEGQLVPQEEYDYFFSLQVQIERTGHMDYFAYVMELWRHYFETEPDLDDPVYREFQSNIILGLKQIEMRDLVYSHVYEKLGDLIRMAVKYASKVVLYSKGDVEATGYQTKKIERSKIIRTFLDGLKQAVPNKEERKDFVKNNTDMIVEDDKATAFRNYLSGINPKPKQVVVVEDSQKNIKRVTEIASEFGIPTVPFWTLYSRSGMRAAEDAQKGDSIAKINFQKMVEEYGGIEKFSELLEHETAFQDALVLVDFDGVIGDHVRMRNAQAQVVWNSVQIAQTRRI